ncbi:MAG: prolyl aminopeptidase [Rickettsiales bacterium]
MTLFSRMDMERDWKYPQPSLIREGLLQVSEKPLHKIAWQEYGNPKGEAVVFIHGGPGGGCEPFMARFFNPDRYRIILFDQRGCGKSIPKASDDDPFPALQDNTTDHLISDVNQLRDELGINGKMHVFGGSWGSTLSLAYAIRHPEFVETLILRGIFLCRRKDLDYFYQGNAATYTENPYDTTLPGTYQRYPEPWKAYVETIAPEKRGDMVKAYAEIFARVPKNEAEHVEQMKAALAWSIWEGATSYLAQDLRTLSRFAEPEFAKAFARIENHYFMNGAFLGGSGEQNRDQNYILQNVDKIKDIPIYIVHGKFDEVCPRFQADELIAALVTAHATQLQYVFTIAGHSMLEYETHAKLVNIMDTLPLMKKA